MQEAIQVGLLALELFEFLLNLNCLQPCQLAQANFKNVFGLAIAELKSSNEVSLWLIAIANDFDDLIDVEQNNLATFQNMNAGIDLTETMLGAARYRCNAEGNPLGNNIF